MNVTLYLDVLGWISAQSAYESDFNEDQLIELDSIIERYCALYIEAFAEHGYRVEIGDGGMTRQWIDVRDENGDLDYDEIERIGWLWGQTIGHLSTDELDTECEALGII